MSLRTAVAVPFRTEGSDRMGESEFVVAVSLDRDWFSPDQAKRLVDVAASEGLLDREGDDLVATFDPGMVDVPDGYTPGEDVLRQRSTFERILEATVDAGIEKQAAVAGVNHLQADLGVTLETAAVLYARRKDVPVEDLAKRVREDL
jgi:hypothetical protein